MIIALAGNPNSGKTTLFNNLTGGSQYVGNWPGVTVEKKDGKLKGHPDVTIQDLPGIYSLSPYSLEEVVARQYLVNEKPDAIINIIDGTNIERNLYLTTQLLELEIPMILAINMIDLVRKNGDQINVKKLENDLGCKVIEMSALKGENALEVAEAAIQMVQEHTGIPQNPHVFTGSVEHALAHIEESIEPIVGSKGLRWFAVKVFERDERAIREMGLSKEILDHVESHIRDCEKELDDDAESIITSQRYDYIAKVMLECVKKKRARGELSVSDKIDKIVTNRILGLPIFFAIMWFVYYVSVSTLGTWMTDWTNDVLFGEIIPPAVSTFCESVGMAGWLESLIVDGIIGGVGTVLGFVPQILLIFLFLAILEDCGYMARIAFVLGRIFRRFGLSGKSFIPILISTGCGVPGIMGTRTIENEKDRRMTIMLTTFIPCSAKTEIIAMITTEFFPGNVWVAWSMWVLSFLVIIFSGIALKKTKLFAGETAPFVMELPAYHFPSGKNVALRVWDRGKHFIVKAGTIIFSIVVIVWFLESFSWSLQLLDPETQLDQSILASIGGALAWIFAPLGFGSWQGTVAIITAEMAKETATSTVVMLAGKAGITSLFTPIAALSFMAMNLFDPPCIAAMSACMREMGDRKWGWIAIGYQFMLGYCLSLVIYQMGSWLFYGAAFGFGQIVAIVIIVAALYFIFRPVPQKQINTQTAEA
ncbi:ferrous iron transport protein B [Catenisphaera adipataccumulans]|uniref:Ferrous iron transport protein B n=1 Tax=Catenisphaera adipataccumulans TaxID=700500 RepID=A0A7W8FW44_9FIRM|nr:ferrous iron transport protein B [Catenisphaera adipataccumulans]MBB5182305.1 ferrous iron transport protein B [Catenisphaera adipataccumulans]